MKLAALALLSMPHYNILAKELSIIEAKFGKTAKYLSFKKGKKKET